MSNNVFKQAIEVLKKNKVRITPQRQIILKYLINHHNHPSVDTIYQALSEEFPNLSMATIYNTLELFEDLGIIIQLPSKDGGMRYDFFGKPHFHSICENCGRIMDVDFPDYHSLDQKLKNVAGQQTDYLLSYSKVEVYGLCPDCQKKFKQNKAKTKAKK